MELSDWLIVFSLCVPAQLALVDIAEQLARIADALDLMHPKESPNADA